MEKSIHVDECVLQNIKIPFANMIIFLQLVPSYLKEEKEGQINPTHVWLHIFGSIPFLEAN